MRVGQRGKFIGHENYEGYLEGGELFTVREIDKCFEDNIWGFWAILDIGKREYLLSDQVQWLTKEDDLKTLEILINKYPEQAKKMCDIK